jgi:hypothetical protein
MAAWRTEQLAFRKPTDAELAILDALLKPQFPGSDELREQLAEIRVREIVGGDGSLEIKAEGALAPVADRVPVEGFGRDTAGVRYHAPLHVVDGLLHELEFLRDDGFDLASRPQAGGLVVTTNQ